MIGSNLLKKRTRILRRKFRFNKPKPKLKFHKKIKRNTKMLKSIRRLKTMKRNKSSNKMTSSTQILNSDVQSFASWVTSTQVKPKSLIISEEPKSKTEKKEESPNKLEPLISQEKNSKRKLQSWTKRFSIFKSNFQVF